MKKFLQEIKVVGFETAGAGPTASKLLAEYGAEVIMIEPLKGINTRIARSFDFYFLHKKSIAVNMKTPEGMAHHSSPSERCGCICQQLPEKSGRQVWSGL